MTSPLADRLARACEKHRERTALVCEGRSLTYAQLLARPAASGAPYLLHHGRKTLEAGAALFDCLRGGVPFVPLDATWPAARVESVREALERPDALKSGDAVVLFTSGSAGAPKGIPLSARNVGYFLDWSTRLLGFAEDDAIPNLAPLGFDLSLLDLLGGWLAGARVELFPAEAVYDPEGLSARLGAEFTSLYASPSLLMHLETRGGLARKLAGGRLRRLVYAGESYPVASLRKLWGAAPAVYNFYGPTETNVCAFHRVREADLTGREIPIGRAPEGTTLTLDAGEIVVRGPGVTRGCLGGESVAGEFRTGDRAELDAEGNLVFRGRLDRQVKIRGARVEPAEVEAVLGGLEGVTRVVVVPRDGSLVAHLEAARPVALEEAKALCARRLPPHMTVSALLLYPEGLPVTERGKIDAGRLREPGPPRC